MFGKRTSQKPSEEFLASFKTAFPELSSPTSSSITATAAGPVLLGQGTTSLTDALDIAGFDRQHGEDQQNIKDLNPTPKANTMDPFRFTPSMMDPNSFTFTNFANQPPGYYTPTPGGTSTHYHSQAGDLHTPGLTMGFGTPISMPNSESSISVGQHPGSTLNNFHSSAFPSHVFQNPEPFAYQSSLAQNHQSMQLPTYAPHQFTHHTTSFGAFQSHPDEAKIHDYSADVEMQEQSSMDTFSKPLSDESMAAPFPNFAMDEFRFHTTLGAPTAMIRHPEEIPVTYLNKGQAYTITIVDTQPTTTGTFATSLPTYRTYIRISFEDEQQRQKPAQCWQLWKDGRGMNEAHHRGGRLLAVEFVRPNMATGVDPQTPQIQVEYESFDGFSVQWTPTSNASTECALGVRFNFLSTDFSHSKGVKGIPVRLCSKTHLVNKNTPPKNSQLEAELCFCKVKLFRDHGAERKLTNDITHVKKNIEKLKQQIAQAESGIKDFGKRKRSESSSKLSSMSRPGKVPKHKRTWSMSSMSDTTPKNSNEDDLQAKLNSYQDMFTSTRPASIFFLKGEDEDDPDRYPVHLALESNVFQRTETIDSNTWDKQSVLASSIVSPTPSNLSIHSQEHSKGQQISRPGPVKISSRLGSNEWQPQSATSEFKPASHSLMDISETPLKTKRITSVPGHLSDWIEAVDVDDSYQPPPERVVKPVACFYIKPKVSSQPTQDDFYRAVYLMQRTVKDLVNEVSRKSGVEASKVIRVIRIKDNSLHVLFDDDTTRELPEGQDMIAEFQEIHFSEPIKHEWESAPADIEVDGELETLNTTQISGYELRLYF